MLGELSGVARFFLVTGYTDMRKSIDGLMAIVRDTYELDPYSNSLFLFCGRRCDRIKALHFEKDGFCLYYKRLDNGRFQYYKRLDNGRFQWPRDSSEVRNLTRQEYRLTFVQKGEIFSSPYGAEKTLRMSYPHNDGTAGRSGG